MASSRIMWRVTPVADALDPTWQGRQIWTRIDVVAGTAGEAILAAIRYDQGLTGRTDETSQDHQQGRSGLEDERLYRVDRLPDEAPRDATPGQVLFAERQAGAPTFRTPLLSM